MILNIGVLFDKFHNCTEIQSSNKYVRVFLNKLLSEMLKNFIWDQLATFRHLYRNV